MPFKDRNYALKYWHEYNKKRYPEFKQKYNSDPEFRKHKQLINRKYRIKVKDTPEFKAKVKLRQQQYLAKKKQQLNQKNEELLREFRDELTDEEELDEWTF